MQPAKGYLRKRRVAEEVLRTREGKEAEVKRIFVGLLIWGVLGFGISFYGTWDFTLQLLPIQQIYGSNLVLNCVFAPGWRIQSESKFYTGGEYRYQNFYFSGNLGDLDVWGKIYFSARDVRYQKLWVNAEIPLIDGKLRFSFDHWATKDDYTTVFPVEVLFPWTSDPSAPARSFYENKYYTVYGEIVDYYRTSTYLNLYMIDKYPKQRFIVYVKFSDIPEEDLKAWLGVTDWGQLVGRTLWVYGKIVNYESPSGVQNPEIQLYSLAYVRDYRLKDIGLGTPIPSSDEEMFGPWPCEMPVTNRVAASTLLTPNWAANRDTYLNKKYFVYGEVKSYTRTSSYLRLHLESASSPYFIIYIPFSNIPEDRLKERLGYVTSWADVIGKKVWIYGTIIEYGGNPEIIPSKIGDLGLGDPPATWPSWPFIDWRIRYTWGQYTLTADFWDCCTGTGLGRVTFEATAIPFLCCGLYSDLSLTFTKASGLEKLSFSLGDLSLCCGITFKISTEFTSTAKTLKIEPEWAGLSGCFTVYGDVASENSSLHGVEIYGFDLVCYVGNVKFRTITAFNPSKVEELTDIPFYLGEFEYWELKYTDTGCCGGSFSFTTCTWFGSKGGVFGLQRFLVRLEVPVASNVTVFTEGHWNFALSSPLLWFDVGWKISF